ncbi:hypothetical protein ABR763_01275 [Bacillus cereus]
MEETKRTVNEPTVFTGKTSWDLRDSWCINADEEGDLYVGIYSNGDNPQGNNYDGALVVTIVEAEQMVRHLQVAINEAKHKKIYGTFREEA